tara:strand:- start:1245 stop:1499 length:255 start_codon:yes stop_codon:yes gene_type:complete
MGACVMCENKNEFWFGSLCSNCRRIKHFISIYGDRVYEVLDSVLSRTDDKQKLKEADEIKKEIENKEHNLRSNKKQIKRGDEIK